jgi:glucosamine-6-phosphate deaminase
MKIVIAPDRKAMGQWVAKHAAEALQQAISKNGEARLLIATGSSQFEVLDALSKHDDVPWASVSGFHLDEYIGLSPTHAASFCGYLKNRFVDRVPLKEFLYLRGDEDAEATIRNACKKIASHPTGRPPIDVALVGIGENGHLAFNDPPADFLCEDAYIRVKLDEACRNQQVGEGWFASLREVPEFAISMSIRQIMKCSKIFCSVPDERKAEAVKNSVEGMVTPDVPASILQQHPDMTLIIDVAAASGLSTSTIQSAVRL